MGTTLNGTTPATTYPSLIKVGDNGAIDATLQRLSDGEGNDLPLLVSTTSVTNLGGGNITTNTAFGKDALISNISAPNMVALGSESGKFINDGSGNSVAIGHQAFATDPQEQELNNSVVIGSQAGIFQPTGGSSSAVNVVVIGYQAKIADALVGGGGNIAIGSGAKAYSEKTIAIGQNALGALNNAFIGRNVAIGHNVAQSLTFAALNVLIGTDVASGAVQSEASVVIGSNAGGMNQVGFISNSTFIGSLAGAFNPGFATQVTGIAIGYNAKIGITASSQNPIAIGNSSVSRGYNSIVLGHNVFSSSGNSIAIGTNSEINGDFSLAIGNNSRAGFTASFTPGSMAIGSFTIEDYGGITIGTQAKGGDTNSVTLGNFALANINATGFVGRNVMIGHEVGGSLIVSMASVGIGYQMGGGTQAMQNSVIIGHRAGNGGDSGYFYNESVIIGSDAGTFNPPVGSQTVRSIAIGAGAVVGSVDTSNDCIAIGTSAFAVGHNSMALGTLSDASGDSSLSIGRFASSGQFSIAIGNGSNASDTSISMGVAANAVNGSIGIGFSVTAAGTNSMALGHDATTSTANELAIGSSSNPLGAVTAGGSGSFSHRWKVTINGTPYFILMQS